MNEYITFADQSVLENAYIAKLDEKNIAVYAKGKYAFTNVYNIFSDKNKTKVMKTNQYGDVYTWTGYTEITVINVTDDYASINLRKQ